MQDGIEKTTRRDIYEALLESLGGVSIATIRTFWQNAHSGYRPF